MNSTVSEDIVMEMYNAHLLGESISKISKRYAYDRNAISRCFKKKNLPILTKKDLYLKMHDEMLKLYESGKSISDISKELKIPPTQIWRVINKDNYITKRTVFDYRHKNLKYKTDELQFSKIDTPNKAYFLGFLYADGNAHSKYYHIKLKLQEKDCHILEDLKSNFGFEQEILKSKSNNPNAQDQRTLIICNKIVYNDFVRHGVRPNKTFKLFYPWFLDKELYSHFVRGYFDGDGCISFDEKRRVCTVSICGTRDMCDDLKIIFKEEIGIDSKVSKDKNIFRVRIRRYSDVQSFKDWIYKNSDLRLNRKFEKFSYIKQEIEGTNESNI